MAAMSYEEARKERLEENKRRMEELGLISLAKDLKKPKIPRKPTTKAKIELQQETRRSSRVAAKPVVMYREQPQKVSGGGGPSAGEARERRERQALRRRYLTEAARKAAIEAAEEVFKNIKNPAFVKPIQHSRVSTVFWIALPEEFCKGHMPLTDEKFMLEDDKEKEWECLYVSTKHGMSSGWRGFAIDHDVMDGDCCIFELVGSLRFKVHIVRFVDDEEDEDDSDESDDSDDSEGEKRPRSNRARRSRRSTSAKKVKDEDDDDEDEDEDEEEEEEEDFDSDVCDDHVSDEEPDEEDSEDDYSPRLSEKEVDTLVAAPSRASRGLKRKIVQDDDDVIELDPGDTSNDSRQEEG